jgi:hypothetical protein
MSDEVKVNYRTYAGLFMVTLATLMYEILLTRIFSVTIWYHYAFMAISIALFGMTKVVEVIKALGITKVTYYRWRQEYGGMSVPQARRLKELEKENERLRKAVSDLTLDKMILKEAAKGNFQAPLAAGPA